MLLHRVAYRQEKILSFDSFLLFHAIFFVMFDLSLLLFSSLFLLPIFQYTSIFLSAFIENVSWY